MLSFRLTLVAMLIFGCYLAGTAPAKADNLAALKIGFLYNFFKFIDWPQDSDSYVLCMSNHSLQDELDNLAGKTIANKPLEVRVDIVGEKLRQCHMVFIGQDENPVPTLNLVRHYPVVTVSDKTGFIQGKGIIGLMTVDNRLAFEINLYAAQSVGLHMDAQILKLAKTVKMTE